jgi:hypothetical protein
VVSTFALSFRQLPSLKPAKILASLKKWQEKVKVKGKTIQNSFFVKSQNK